MRKSLAPALITASLVFAIAPARAVDAPYDAGLYRLAEILGSLHFLRNLCGEKGVAWRTEMERLLEAEQPDAERRAKFVANFNRGYRSFATTYTSCTTSAIAAIDRYSEEGQRISNEIVGRYGN